MLKREIINEMNELSKEVFGSVSKWRKILEKGETRILTEEETIYNPEPKEGEQEVTKRTVATLHHGPNGGKLVKHETYRYTVEELKARMLEVKSQRIKLLEAMKKQEEIKEAAKEIEDNTKLIISKSSGTAVV